MPSGTRWSWWFHRYFCLEQNTPQHSSQPSAAGLKSHSPQWHISSFARCDFAHDCSRRCYKDDIRTAVHLTLLVGPMQLGWWKQTSGNSELPRKFMPSLCLLRGLKLHVWESSHVCSMTPLLPDSFPMQTEWSCAHLSPRMWDEPWEMSFASLWEVCTLVRSWNILVLGLRKHTLKEVMGKIRGTSQGVVKHEAWWEDCSGMDLLPFVNSWATASPPEDSQTF